MNTFHRVSIIILFIQLSITTFGSSEFVRVVFNSNASHEATIIWNQKSGEFVRLVMDTIPPEPTQNSRTLELSDRNHYKGMSNHLVRLKNLKANTRYYFYIEDSEGKNRLYYFSTVSDSSNDKLSFIAGGDSRDIRNVRIRANKMVSKLKAHAVLFNGDFTGIDTERQWKEWFSDWENSISSDGRITPLTVTRGNHELGNKVMIRLFDVPHSKVFYSTTFGGDLLNIISLNSEIWKFGAQRLFLRKTLQK